MNRYVLSYSFLGYPIVLLMIKHFIKFSSEEWKKLFCIYAFCIPARLTGIGLHILSLFQPIHVTYFKVVIYILTIINYYKKGVLNVLTLNILFYSGAWQDIWYFFTSEIHSTFITYLKIQLVKIPFIFSLHFMKLRVDLVSKLAFVLKWGPVLRQS